MIFFKDPLKYITRDKITIQMGLKEVQKSSARQNEIVFYISTFYFVKHLILTEISRFADNNQQIISFEGI